MKTFLRTAVFAAISFGLMLSQTNVAKAQSVDDRAAVVMKMSSIDDTLDSVGYMVGAAGFRNFVPMITLGAGAFLDGFDTERPLGGYMIMGDNGPAFVGFVPVDDLGDVLDMLETNAGIEIEKDGDDYILITPPGEEIVVRGKGKWAFFSDNADNLDELPADPAKMVAGISDEYMFGMKAYVQRVPADMRSQAIEWMEEAFEESYNNIPGGAAELQRKMNENSLDQLADMIQQSDEIFMGFAANRKDKALYFDFSFTGKKGSELARNLVAGKGAKTDFGAFLKAEDAAMTFNASSKVAQSDAEQGKASLQILKDQIGELLREDGNLSDNDADLIEDLVTQLSDVLIATIESGKIDLGAAVIIDDEGLNAVMGAHVADAKKVEAAVKKLVAEKGDQIPPQVDVKLDAETYKGMTLHMLSGSIPEEEVRPILGETTTLVVAIGQSKIYAGFGSNPVDKMKAMIDKAAPSKQEYPSKMTFKLSPVLRMAGKASDQAMLLEMADQLEEDGNQMIELTTEYIENGQKTRMKIEDGILGLIELGASGFGGGGGGFGGDF